MKKDFNILYLILGIPALVSTVLVVVAVMFIIRVSTADPTILPSIKIDLPNGYIPTRLIESTTDTFIVYGVRGVNNFNSDAKLFLFSSSGKVLDVLDNLKGGSWISNIKDVGIVVSDYSSSYVGENLNYVIVINNGKIIKGKDLGSKFRIYDSQHLRYPQSSTNFFDTYKCYLKLDIVMGRCTYGVETISVDDKKIQTSKYHLLDSLKVDERHTAAIIKDNSQVESQQLLIFGSK